MVQTVANLVRQIQPPTGDSVSSGGAELAEILENVRALRDEVKAADSRLAILHSLVSKVCYNSSIQFAYISVGYDICFISRVFASMIDRSEHKPNSL